MEFATERMYTEIIDLYKSGRSFREVAKLGYSKYHVDLATKGITRNLSESGKLRALHCKPIAGVDARKKLSQEQSLRNRGGKCKWFKVSGQKVQGTWERDLALAFNKLGIQWIKPTVNRDIWKYYCDGKIKSYTPDFYLPEFDVYIELKGYWWGDDKRKMDIIKQTYPYKKLLVVEKQEFYDSIKLSQLS